MHYGRKYKYTFNTRKGIGGHDKPNNVCTKNSRFEKKSFKS